MRLAFIIYTSSSAVAEKPWVSFGQNVTSLLLQGIRVKFVYEGHRVKVKVTEAKTHEIPYSRNENFDWQ